MVCVHVKHTRLTRELLLTTLCRRELERRGRPTDDAKFYSDLLQMQAVIEEHDARAEQEGSNPVMVVRGWLEF
jgi:hypothetical protein